MTFDNSFVIDSDVGGGGDTPKKSIFSATKATSFQENLHGKKSPKKGKRKEKARYQLFLKQKAEKINIEI